MKYAIQPVLDEIKEFVESKHFTVDDTDAEWISATTYIDGAKALRLLFKLYRANEGGS